MRAKRRSWRASRSTYDRKARTSGSRSVLVCQRIADRLNHEQPRRLERPLLVHLGLDREDAEELPVRGGERVADVPVRDGDDEHGRVGGLAILEREQVAETAHAY